MRTAYNQAETLAYFRLDQLFDFDDQQARWIKTRLREHHAWHRSTQLPAYATFLREFRDRLGRGLRGEDIDWSQAQAARFRDALMGRIYADAEKTLLALSGEQVAALPDRFEDYNKELAKNVARPPEERKRRRVEQSVDSAEDWMGALQNDQEELIASFSARLPDEAPLRLQMNRARQQSLVAALQMDGEERPKRLRELLRAWLLQPERSRPEYYRAATNRWRIGVRTMALEIDRVMTPGQRRYFQARLSEWIEDLERLAAGV